MSEQEILECNKLLGKFIASDILSTGTFYFDSLESKSDVLKGYFDERGLLFHKKWDWLMPVVRKIITMDKIPASMDWQGSMFMFPITASVGRVEFLTSYKLCVQFVTWYNEQNDRSGN